MIVPFSPEELATKTREEIVAAYKAIDFTDEEAEAFTDVLLGDGEVEKSMTVSLPWARQVADQIGDAEFTKAVEAAEQLELSEVVITKRGGTLNLTQPTGVIIAWFSPPGNSYISFDVDGGVSDQHITIANLGDASQYDVTAQRTIIGVAAEVASRHKAMRGVLGGTELFQVGEKSGNAWVVHAQIEGLQQFRDDLVAGLSDAGISLSENYDFTPHMTLAWIDKDAEAPAVDFAPTTILVDEVTVAIAGLHFTLALTPREYDPDEKPLVPWEEEVRTPFVPVVKSLDEEKQFTLGPVYVPGMIDAHGDWATADDLQESLWDFAKSEKTIDIQHSGGELRGHGEVVELVSWPWEHSVDMPNDDGTIRKVTFPAGTPWMGVVWDDQAWPLVKSGKVRGYSIGGRAVMINEFPESASEVVKANPYHDPENGRFTSKTGGYANALATPDGGFTVMAGKEVNSGYAVSRYPDRSLAIPSVVEIPKAKLAQKISDYAAQNSDLLSTAGHALGGWHDPKTGTAYLDISEVTDSAETAAQIALDHDQIAYFDFSTFESVTVNPDATSGQS